MAISYITSDGTIRHDLTGDTFGIPSISQVTADAITSKPVGLIANIDGSLKKWSGTIWEKQLKDSDVSEPDLDQFIEVGGRYVLATPFKKVTSNFPTVTTEASKIHGSRTSPQYHFLSLPASLTTAQKQWLNKVKVVHSGLVVPSVLIPNKPTSPLAIYTGLTNPTSPLATYASQAAMTADFANQVLDSYYYFTGSNTAWKYNGTATDSINNYVAELYMLGDQSAQVTGEYYEYTGSTSLWQKTATSTGVIGNYTELVEVPGWETWGIKPSYLIVQGDAYSVGENNVNELDFVYHDLIKIDGVSYADVVVVTNTAHTDMNADSEKIKVSLLIHYAFNENNVVQNDSLVNSSIYGDLFPCTITNPNTPDLLPYYNDLGGSNYSLVLGVGAAAYLGNVATAPFRDIERNETLDRIFENQEMTIIARKEFRTLGMDANIPIINNSLDGVGGFEFVRVSTGDMSFRIYYPAGSRFFLMTLTDKITRDTGLYTMAVTFSKPAVDQLVIKGYLKSSDNLIPFSEVFSTTNTNALNTETTLVGGDLRLDKLGVSSTNVKPVEDDDLRLYGRVLTEAEISAIMTELDG